MKKTVSKTKSSQIRVKSKTLAASAHSISQQPVAKLPASEITSELLRQAEDAMGHGVEVDIRRFELAV